jgi:hypothetical protein
MSRRQDPVCSAVTNKIQEKFVDTIQEDDDRQRRQVSPSEAHDRAAGPSSVRHGDGHLVAFIEERQLAYRGPLSHYLVSWTLFQHGTVAILHWLPTFDPETRDMVHDSRRPLKMADVNAYMCQRITAFVSSEASVTPLGDITDFEFESAQTRDANSYSIDCATAEPYLEVHVLCRASAEMSTLEATTDAHSRLTRDTTAPMVAHTSHAVQRPKLLAFLHTFTPLSIPLVATIYDYLETA